MAPCFSYKIWPTYRNRNDSDNTHTHPHEGTIDNEKNCTKVESVNNINTNNSGLMENVAKQQEQQQQEGYDIARYRNRAELTQRVLKEKLKEIKLLKSKVIVLENVVKHLRKEIADFREQKQRSKAAMQTEVEHAEQEISDALQREFHRTRQTLEDQIKQHLQQNQILETELGQQQKLNSNLQSSAEAAKQEWMDEKYQFESQIRALEKKILDMNNTIETMQGQRLQLQRLVATQEDEIRMQAQQNFQKRIALKARIKKLETERQDAVMNATRFEDLRQESIQIATASVRAAARREEAYKNEVMLLRKQLLTLEQEKDALQSMLASGDTNSKLQEEIASLKKTLIEDKLAYDVRRKVDKEQFEIREQAQQQEYEKEISRLRRQLSDRPFDVENNNNAIRMRLQRFWHRIQGL